MPIARTTPRPADTAGAGAATPIPRRGSTLLVITPSLVSLGAAVLALALAWLGGSRNAVEYCLVGIYAGVGLSIGSLVLIAILPYRDRLLRCVVVLALAPVSTLIAAAIWAQAVDVTCLPGNTCPFG